MCRKDHPVVGFSKPPWAGVCAMLAWWTSSLWSWTHHRAWGWQRAWCRAVDVWDLCFPLCHILRLASEGVVQCTGVLSPKNWDLASCPVPGFSPVIWEGWHGVTVSWSREHSSSPTQWGQFCVHSHCVWLGQTGGTQQSRHDVDTAGVGWEDRWQIVEVTRPSSQVSSVLSSLPLGLYTRCPVCLGCFSSCYSSDLIQRLLFSENLL